MNKLLYHTYILLEVKYLLNKLIWRAAIVWIGCYVIFGGHSILISPILPILPAGYIRQSTALF